MAFSEQPLPDHPAMNRKRKIQEDGANDALTPHPTRRTRRLDEGDLLSDALQPFSLKRVTPRSAAKKEEASSALAAESVHSPGTSDAQNPKPPQPVPQEGRSSTAQLLNDNLEAALQPENATRGGAGACMPPSRPFTPYTGGPFSPNTDISIGGCSYGTPEQMEESEFPDAPGPAPGDASEDDHDIGDESFDEDMMEDSSITITDEEDNSSEDLGWPDGTASDETAVPKPDALFTAKGMTIECLEDARRALAIAIVKMDANERDTGVEADATIVLHHMKQRLRPGDREALDQLQMDIFLERLHVHPNKTIQAKAHQLYSKETGYVLSSKPMHSTKPLAQLLPLDEAALPPLSDAELRKDAEDWNTLSGAPSGQAGDAAGEAGIPDVCPPAGQQELACHDGTLLALHNQTLAPTSRPSGSQRSGVRSTPSQGTSVEMAQAGEPASERLPEVGAQDRAGGASMPNEGGVRPSSSVAYESETCAGNSARGFVPRDRDTSVLAGPAGQAPGLTSPVDSRQRRSGQESSQEHIDGKVANSGVEAHAVPIPDTFAADSNRLTTPPTPPGSWLASPRILNTGSEHDAGQPGALESGPPMLANMQGLTSEPFPRPLSSSSNANPSSQGAISSGSRARNSEGAGVDREASRRKGLSSGVAHSLADASEWPTSQALPRAGSSDSFPFGLETVPQLDRARQRELLRMYTARQALNGSLALNSEAAGYNSNASWMDNLGIGAGQSLANGSQGFSPQENGISRAHAARTALSGLLSMGISAPMPATRGDASLWGEASGARSQSAYLQGLPSRAPHGESAAHSFSLVGSRSNLQGTVPSERDLEKTAQGVGDIRKQVQNLLQAQMQAGQVDRPPQPHGPPTSGSVQLEKVQPPRSGLQGISNAEVERLIAGGNMQSEGMVMPRKKGLEMHQVLQMYQGDPNGASGCSQGRQDHYTVAAQALSASIQRARERPANADPAVQRASVGTEAQAKTQWQRENEAAQMVYNDAMMGLGGRHNLVPVLQSRVIAQRMLDQNPRMALGPQHLGMHGNGQQHDRLAKLESLLGRVPPGMSREAARKWLTEKMSSISAGRSHNGLGISNMGHGLGRLAARDPLDEVQHVNNALLQAAAVPDRVQQALQALATTSTYVRGWDAPAMGNDPLPSQSQADTDTRGAVMEMLRQWNQQS